LVFTVSKLSVAGVTAPVPTYPTTKPTYLTGPWSSDASVYFGDQWPDNGRSSALAGTSNHAHSGSSFYATRAAMYPTGQPHAGSGSGFPGNTESGRNVKLKSEHLSVVGVC